MLRLHFAQACCCGVTAAACSVAALMWSHKIALERKSYRAKWGLVHCPAKPEAAASYLAGL